MTAAVKTLAEHACFGGRQGFYEHASDACSGPMRFSVYLPPHAIDGEKVPAVYYLAGLTCTEETFVIKAGAQRVAASLGLAVVTCDTSPRAFRAPGDDASWDFGQGAGFYLDATQEPWSAAYRMETYVASELPALVEQAFPVLSDRRGIFGHSMGGHGALTLALRHPGRYASASALAPIGCPSVVPWGIKAFTGYLGADRAAWADHDASLLAKKRPFPGELLIDQGTADKFLQEQLRPLELVRALREAKQAFRLRVREGYDHSYYFVQSFVGDHLEHHARALVPRANTGGFAGPLGRGDVEHSLSGERAPAAAVYDLGGGLPPSRGA